MSALPASEVALRALEYYPDARLAVPFDDLDVLDLGISGRRLTALPVTLR